MSDRTIGTRQKNKRRGIETWDQTGSPEIPDRGEGDISGGGGGGGGGGLEEEGHEKQEEQ